MTSDAVLNKALDERSVDLRKKVVGAMVKAGRGHLGPAMSVMEILRVLYDDVLNVDPADPASATRDRMILSKGHGCLALYVMLAEKGFFPAAALDTFCEFDSILGGHPSYGVVPGVEASTGALGHGLSLGVGMALAARIKKEDHRIFVIMGDGEINEGSVWEAAMSAGKHQLTNLVGMIDYNKMQSYGSTGVVQDLEPLADKWRSFGFSVAEVDGHDVEALRAAFASPSEGKPHMVICHTVKGKGIPDAEHNAHWHHKNKLNDDELAGIRAALGEF